MKLESSRHTFLLTKGQKNFVDFLQFSDIVTMGKITFFIKMNKFPKSIQADNMSSLKALGGSHCVIFQHSWQKSVYKLFHYFVGLGLCQFLLLINLVYVI